MEESQVTYLPEAKFNRTHALCYWGLTKYIIHFSIFNCFSWGCIFSFFYKGNFPQTHITVISQHTHIMLLNFDKVYNIFLHIYQFQLGLHLLFIDNKKVNFPQTHVTVISQMKTSWAFSWIISSQFWFHIALNKMMMNGTNINSAHSWNTLGKLGQKHICRFTHSLCL